MFENKFGGNVVKAFDWAQAACGDSMGDFYCFIMALGIVHALCGSPHSTMLADLS